jgi:hypothetical protein
LPAAKEVTMLTAEDQATIRQIIREEMPNLEKMVAFLVSRELLEAAEEPGPAPRNIEQIDLLTMEFENLRANSDPIHKRE